MRIVSWFDWLDFGCSNSHNCMYDDEPNDATLSLHNGMAAVVDSYAGVMIVESHEDSFFAENNFHDNVYEKGVICDGRNSSDSVSL